MGGRTPRSLQQQVTTLGQSHTGHEEQTLQQAEKYGQASNTQSRNTAQTSSSFTHCPQPAQANKPPPGWTEVRLNVQTQQTQLYSLFI